MPAGAKQRDLRVREDNPALGVEPPDRGTRKGKQFLYPSEFGLIAQNDRIPRAWQRFIALALYLFPRAGELEALEWEDVDLERGVVHVHRSIDRARGSTKSTKTGSPRRFNVEPAALPLLRKMHEERTGDGVVLERMPRHRDLAEGLRTYLEVAGVKRPELFTTDKTRKAITFHDLRATGLTWMAIRGDEPLRIMQRAGHESFATTQLYVREAEAIREGFGEVFPPLTSLIETSPTGERAKIGPRRRDLERLKRGVSRRYVAGSTGLERERRKRV
jgi:integrase